VGLRQSSVIRIIHCNDGLKSFFHLPKFLLLSLVFAYIYILQGSVEMHLLCGGIYNNHFIANCLQSVPVKELRKSVNNWRRYMDKSNMPRFMAHGVDTALLEWVSEVAVRAYATPDSAVS